MNQYKYILNPENNSLIDINTNLAKKILKKYINKIIGGAAEVKMEDALQITDKMLNTYFIFCHGKMLNEDSYFIVPEGYNFITLDIPGLTLDTKYDWEFVEKIDKLINENKLNILLDPFKVDEIPDDILSTTAPLDDTHIELTHIFDETPPNIFPKQKFVIRHHYSGQKIIDHELNFFNTSGGIGKDAMQITGIFNLFNKLERTKNTMIGKLFYGTDITSKYIEDQLSLEQHYIASYLSEIKKIPLVNAQKIIINNKLTDLNKFNEYKKFIETHQQTWVNEKATIETNTIETGKLLKIAYRLIDNHIYIPRHGETGLLGLELASKHLKMSKDDLYKLFTDFYKILQVNPTWKDWDRAPYKLRKILSFERYNEVLVKKKQIRRLILNFKTTIFNNDSIHTRFYNLQKPRLPKELSNENLNYLIPYTATINNNYHVFPRNKVLQQFITSKNKFKFSLFELIENKILLPGTYFLGFCRSFNQYYYQNPDSAKLIRQKSIELYEKKAKCKYIPCNISSSWDNDCSMYDCNKCVNIGSNKSRCKKNLKLTDELQQMVNNGTMTMEQAWDMMI